jgi:hypothetical protein
MTRQVWALAFVAVTCVSCASGPTVHTDVAPDANFSNFRTFTWVFEGAPRGMNPILFDRVRSSIDRQLQAQGFTAGQPGDFAVGFTIGARDRVEVTDFGPYAGSYVGWGWRNPGMGGSTTTVRQFTEGSLTIDIYDVATRRAVWHGVATQTIGSGNVDQAQIDTAVAAVLRDFPPH